MQPFATQATPKKLSFLVFH